MSQPKKKTSRGRRDRRRHNSASGLSAVEAHQCKNCQSLTRPHRVCSHCGHYDGKPVVSTSLS
ncbi:MAG: 50S ribosomal protein L32 [Bdellovibrionaceae bacterium]|nr:50S ribosomal protein L32 [Pseudobdellovibrionaceae bacterium]